MASNDTGQLDRGGGHADPPTKTADLYEQEEHQRSAGRRRHDPLKGTYSLARHAFVGHLLDALLLLLLVVNLIFGTYLYLHRHGTTVPDAAPERAEATETDQATATDDTPEGQLPALAGNVPAYDPEAIERAYALAQVARRFEVQGRETQAIETFRETLELVPGPGWLWGELGHLHLRRKDYERAQGLLEQSIVLDPFNVRYLNSLGAVYLLNFGTTRALQVFEHAADVDPDYAATYLNLALCRLRSDYFGARRALARYLNMEPDNPVGRRLEAFLALAAGRDREALVALNKALQAAPNWAALYFDAARVAARLRNDEKAIQYLLEVLPYSSPSAVLTVFDEATFSDTRQSPAGRAFREQMITRLSEKALSDREEAP